MRKDSFMLKGSAWGKFVKINPSTKKVIWSYDCTKSNGNKGKRVEAHAFQLLEGGNMMIAESGSGRIIEINKNGKINKRSSLEIR